mmetsp:Transcript_5090/g.15468  ORF Transcript_5090/g.15468 Transcript_5090/m.15468 type:complete len:234 (-) Transcript_5090:1207-1908(-)
MTSRCAHRRRRAQAVHPARPTSAVLAPHWHSANMAPRLLPPARTACTAGSRGGSKTPPLRAMVGGCSAHRRPAPACTRTRMHARIHACMQRGSSARSAPVAMACGAVWSPHSVAGRRTAGASMRPAAARAEVDASRRWQLGSSCWSAPRTNTAQSCTEQLMPGEAARWRSDQMGANVHAPPSVPCSAFSGMRARRVAPRPRGSGTTLQRHVNAWLVPSRCGVIECGGHTCRVD